MGLIGKYIDSLNDEQRDRVIQHPDPNYGGRAWRWYFRSRNFGCACLVGAAEEVPEVAGDSIDDYRKLLAGWVNGLSLSANLAGQRFPELTDRFGAPRVWRLVKARAAKGHALPIARAQQTREPSAV